MSTIYDKILNECSIAYAKIKLIFDQGTPIDYQFMDCNQAYLSLMRTTKKHLIGKTAKVVFSSDLEQTQNWIESYNDVLDHKTHSFIQYSPQFGQTFFVKAYQISEDEIVSMVENYDPYKIAYQKLKGDHELILDAIAEGIIVVSKNYEITSINRRALQILGYEDELGIIGVSIFEFLFDNQKEHKLNQFLNLIDAFPFYNRQTKFIKKDKNWVDARFSVNNRILESSNLGYVISFTDITVEKELQSELQNEKQSKAIVLNHLPGMIYRCLADETWTMLYASDGTKDLTGYESSDLIHNKRVSFRDIVHPDYRKALDLEWAHVIKNQLPFEKEYMIITKQGQNKWVYEKGTPVYDEDGKPIALEGVILDLNRRRERDLEIEHMMYHDQLTGLRNRLFFDHMLEELEQQKQYPIGIMVADVDSLKFINDTLGRATGDQVISDIASILRTFEINDVVVARTGGDEFSLILPNSDSTNTYNIMIAIQEAIKGYQYLVNGITHHLSISMGFETKRDETSSMTEIIKHAEDYMHRRKLIARSQTNRDSLSSIKATMIANSQETQEHMDRMADIAKQLGIKLGLRQSAMDDLYLLAMLHDIGKIGIPSHILNKPGKLTDEEWNVMKTHPMIGYQIAQSSTDIKSIAEGILHHHERFDGQGYPSGLKGRDIPLISRIIAIIDSYDAMTQDRPYRKKRSHEAAIAEIIACKHTQFDPDIVDVFLTIFE